LITNTRGDQQFAQYLSMEKSREIMQVLNSISIGDEAVSTTTIEETTSVISTVQAETGVHHRHDWPASPAVQVFQHNTSTYSTSTAIFDQKCLSSI
jgi:hypothetical protein